MTLPLFLADPGSLDALAPGAAFTLDGPEGRHAVTVRRLQAGERLYVADGHGVRVTGVVGATAPGELTLTVSDVVREPRPDPTLTLVQALAKSDRDDAAIEAATELGVDTVIPWQAARSIVQWRGERGVRARQKWVDVVRAATKRSRRSWVPEVGELATSASLARLATTASAMYVLHEDATDPLVGQSFPDSGEIVLVVGPEGGITPAEIDALVAAGAIPVRLGSSVLRSSSAGPAAIAAISALTRWR